MALPTIRKILYTSDLGDAAPMVFAYATVMARQFDATISFLHVIEPLGPTGQTLVRNMVQREQLERLQSEALRKLRSEIRERIERFCREEVGSLAEEESRIEDIRIADGHPAEMIMKQAEELESDVIVMGTHSGRGLHRVLLGSVAGKVVARASCPVFLVPIPEDVR